MERPSHIRLMYIELHCHTEYSFLDGASEIEDLVHRASEMGMPALAMTDHNSLAAAVKFNEACENYGIKPIFGAEITLEDESHLTLLAENRTGYANICTLISLAYECGGRLTPKLPWEKLALHSSGVICLSGCKHSRISQLAENHRYAQAYRIAARLRKWFGSNNFFIELQDDYQPHSLRIARDLAAMADRLRINVVATNNVHYARPDGFITHDILRCISAGITVNDVHPSRPLNAERYLKMPEMAELFCWRPDAVANTVTIANRCAPCLPLYEEITPQYQGDAPAILRERTYLGAKERYKTITSIVRQRIEHELEIICTLGFAGYFLHVNDIVRWARSEGIRCCGRGSAADSCIAYCLYITDIDVIERNLPFTRFLVPGKTPDIDVDFPSDRRDEVFLHIAQTYGKQNVARVCTFHTFWARSAVRDIGKALALPEDTLDFLSKHLSHFLSANDIADAFQRMPELKPHAGLVERFQTLFDLCKRIAGFPRHIGSHSSAVVISRVPLATVAPVHEAAGGVLPIWTLDKDDAEIAGAIKFDVLALRMLSAVKDTENDIDDPEFRYDDIPMDDDATYRMFRAGKAIGAFQFESAGQLSLAVKLHPRHFEDLVAAVALIRPGPIRGGVVERFVSARNGWTQIDLLHPALFDIVEKTYGCVVFQEQADQIIARMMGLSDVEADKFRKNLKRHRKKGTLNEPREQFVRSALANYADLTPKRAHMIFDEIEGWSGYGFIEGHAGSFALTGYRTAYLSVHYAAEFYASMMNHQPMGFYSANTLAAEARRRGVQILPVDINKSEDKCYSEEPDSIRLGLRLVAELREDDISAILEARATHKFYSLLDFCARVPMRRPAIENLILCGAFDPLHDHRRGLLYALEQTISMALTYRQMQDTEVSQLAFNIGAHLSIPTPVAEEIDDFSEWDKFLWSWRITGVTAECHAFAYLREGLASRNFITVYEALHQKQNTVVWVAGINVRPHRPPTRSGEPVLFACLEDETEMLQMVVVGDAIDRCTPVFLLSAAVMVEGVIKRRGTGAVLNVMRAKPLSIKDIHVRTNIGIGQSRPSVKPAGKEYAAVV